MRVISAHVRKGAIVPDEETALPEGAAVTVLADADEREFDVPPELEADLLSVCRKQIEAMSFSLRMC